MEITPIEIIIGTGAIIGIIALIGIKTGLIKR